MKTTTQTILHLCLALFSTSALLAQLPVVSSHPRIFMDAVSKTELLNKKNNLDPNWLEVKAEADEYASATVLTWTPATANEWGGAGTIFYSYCGSSWEDAVLTLGLAHQLTKDNLSLPGGNPTIYSAKLLELADEIITAYNTYPPGAGQGNIFQYNTSYATRHIGKVIGLIYDWCYDELGTTRKAALVAVMEDWYNYMKVPFNVYQLQDHSTGNYYFGHVMCAAYMGYAIAGDSPIADQMIAFARQRIFGTPSSLLSVSDCSSDYFVQSLTGGLPSSACRTYLGPETYTGAPQKDGIPVQGWAYGGTTTETIIDYCYMVKTATTETIADSLSDFFDKTAEALVHAYTPNRFQVDNSNDNGSFVGSLASYSLPLRLSYITEGKASGPNAEYFYRSWLEPVAMAQFNEGYPALAWEKLLFEKTRPMEAFDYKPYYPIPNKNTYSSLAIDEGLFKYYVRKDWSKTSTWYTFDMGAAYYDDHAHNNAGHFKILRGDSYDGDDILLVGANEVGNGGDFGTQNGIEGETTYGFSSSFSNTLFIDDYDDYDGASQVFRNTVGGQFGNGYDEPSHVEQTDDFSHFRSDLTSSYYNNYYDPDTADRSIRYYFRTFLYLRNSDITLVYDNLLAKNSTNALGQYQKHLRWHFLEEPTINGNNIGVQMGNSKLNIHTVIPTVVNINTVNESANPDNTFGSVLDYHFNTNTWRAEVNVPGNPLKQDFLSVFQPGDLTLTEMQTTSLTSLDDAMEGTVVEANGNVELVLFNKSTAKYPLPITSTSYTFTGNNDAWHNLCGFTPNGLYLVEQNGNTYTITQSATGNVTASASGVLRFQMSALLGIDELLADTFELFPNPIEEVFTIKAKTYSFYQIEVYNQLGILLQNDLKDDLISEISMKNYQSGVYFVKLKTATGERTYKIIKK